MNIGVIGKGTVGSAVYEGLKHIGHNVSFYDPKYPESSLEDVLDTACLFVAVPTDQAPNGDCDTSIVESVIDVLNQNSYAGLIALKSTIVPGTTEKLISQYPDLRICNVLEFLRAKTALADFVYNQDIMMVGSNKEEDFELMKEVHGKLPKQSVLVSPTEAEIVKYFNNVHHAMNITFANITYEVCEKLGANYQNVYDTITKRDCFNPSYLDCNANLRGYGGHCLPKDTSAWNNLIKKLGLDFTLIQSVLDDNEKYNG